MASKWFCYTIFIVDMFEHLFGFPLFSFAWNDLNAVNLMLG